MTGTENMFTATSPITEELVNCGMTSFMDDVADGITAKLPREVLLKLDNADINMQKALAISGCSLNTGKAASVAALRGKDTFEVNKIM